MAIRAIEETYGNPTKGVVTKDPYAKIRENLQLGTSALLPDIKITIPMPVGSKTPRV